MFRVLALASSILAAASCARQDAGEDPLAGVQSLDASLVAYADVGAGEHGESSSQVPRGAEAKGALLYLELGCVACHVPPGVARPAFAPDHSAVGLLGEARLREVIRQPERAHPGTIMPAYRLDEEDEADLVAFLSARRSGLPAPAPVAATKPCASCHAAGAETGAGHRCAYLADRRDELACVRCHETVPSGERCAFVESHRPSCTVCHRVEGS